LGRVSVARPKRKGFYDLENYERTFFIQISSLIGRAVLLATWRKALVRRLDAGSYELEESMRLREYQPYEQHGKHNDYAFARLVAGIGRANSAEKPPRCYVTRPMNLLTEGLRASQPPAHR
jgi:hypothetical protein